ncbi:MAG: tetratricopeptide repeat protein [Desulfosudaceae bacterium]
MAKISRVSLHRKRELEKPDRFMAMLQAGAAFVSRNRRVVVTTAGLVLVAAVIAAAVAYWNEKSEASAANQLAAIMNEAAASGPDAETSAALRDRYQSLYQEHGGSLAGKIAGLHYADACYRSGDTAAAMATYRQLASDFRGTPLFRRLALEGLGYACEAAEKTEEAAEAFRQITEDQRLVPQDQALFNLARIYDQMGKVQQSRALFARLAKEYPDSLYAPLARQYQAG